jgi:hypothetical protein
MSLKEMHKCDIFLWQVTFKKKRFFYCFLRIKLALVCWSPIINRGFRSKTVKQLAQKITMIEHSVVYSFEK